MKTGGGPCDYHRYQGRAEILSVQPKAMPGGESLPHETYEVLFRFYLLEPIAETWACVEDRTHQLTLINGWYPGPKFLGKYEIAAGASKPCDLKVIVGGTCTPVLFEFPGIDLGDYFESRP